MIDASLVYSEFGNKNDRISDMFLDTSNNTIYAAVNVNTNNTNWDWGIIRVRETNNVFTVDASALYHLAKQEKIITLSQ